MPNAENVHKLQLHSLIKK